MAVLQSTNVQGALCVNGVAVGGGKDFKFCCFSGSGNWTPSQDLVDGGGSVESIMVAGGGGGGAVGSCWCRVSISGGGGGGEVTHKYHTITATTDCCHSIGQGGNGGLNVHSGPGVWTSAGKGGNTTFLGHTAYGGGGGVGQFTTGLSGGQTDSTNQIGGPAGGAGAGGSTPYSVCGYGGASSNWNVLGINGGTSYVISGSGDTDNTRNLVYSWVSSGAGGIGDGPEKFGSGGSTSNSVGMGIKTCDPTSCAVNVVTSSVFGGGGPGAYSQVPSPSPGPMRGGGHGAQGIIILKWAE